MNSTAGKVNLNNKVYPESESFAPPLRKKPLEAVFRYLREDHEVSELVDSISSYQDEGNLFAHIGELVNVPGVDEGDTAWEREALLRHMASTLTTQSNTFGVWGVAQVITKLPPKQRTLFYFDKVIPNELQEGDSIQGERRFYALVERYVWAGKDGVPGNAHTDGKGEWDRLAEPATSYLVRDGLPWPVPAGSPRIGKGGSFAPMDGPQEVNMKLHESVTASLEHQKSSLEDAVNPVDPVIKYRVVYFKYLDH